MATGFQVPAVSRTTRGQASGAGPQEMASTRKMLLVKGTLFDQKLPHPVASRVLEVLVLLVTALHQCGECEVVELVAAALLRPVGFCEATAAIRALIFVVNAIVVEDAIANL